MRISVSTAVWRGDLKDGEGKFEADSGAFQGEYGFGTRFGEAPGTNPEELLAAAHASCYSMALAHALSEAGHQPDLIETRAFCTLEEKEGGFAVTGMRLVTRARVRGADEASFREVAQQAKGQCPLSKVMDGNVAVELDAALES